MRLVIHRESAQAVLFGNLVELRQRLGNRPGAHMGPGRRPARRPAGRSPGSRGRAPGSRQNPPGDQVCRPRPYGRPDCAAPRSSICSATGKASSTRPSDSCDTTSAFHQLGIVGIRTQCALIKLDRRIKIAGQNRLATGQIVHRIRLGDRRRKCQRQSRYSGDPGRTSNTGIPRRTCLVLCVA